MVGREDLASTGNWSSSMRLPQIGENRARLRDRFYAFDKSNGELVWSSTPGITPKDSSFSPLIFEDTEDGRRVFYSGTGCGHVVCIDARTGQALWRFQMSYGGVNAGIVLHKNLVVAIHGKENVDTSVIGRMVAIKKPKKLPAHGEEILPLGKEDEAWRNNHMESFTSTPVYRDGRLYTTIKRGELVCTDASTGKDHWVLKLAPDQVHASPTWADDKLYVPMFDGKVSVVKDEGKEGRLLGKTELDGACLAAPSVAHGRVFIQTKKRLYCFGSGDPAPAFVAQPSPEDVGVGPAVSLQVVPAEFAVKSGESQAFKGFALDRTGRRIEQIKEGLAWENGFRPRLRYSP